jgi:glycosyltransferase involved in cell wall biosynthesis
MRVLHIAAHLGGGVGKAHGAMAPYMPPQIDRLFAVLQKPIDPRPIKAIEESGGRVVVCAGWPKNKVRALSDSADIIQFEYWGHPDFANVLDGWRLPGDLRTVCWCHVSGLSPPRIPDGMLRCDRFVVTSKISLPVLPKAISRRARLINSGFGFEWPRPSHGKGTIYLGTVDFKKMHPEFFVAIDEYATAKWAPISVWGHIGEDARAAHAAMANPSRVRLRGHTLDPHAAMAEGSVFLYPLNPNHYGTAENALIEAMSIGLIPIVLDNPAEKDIVTQGINGLIATDLRDAILATEMLLNEPHAIVAQEIRERAMISARERSAHRSAKSFVELWRQLVTDQTIARSA